MKAPVDLAMSPPPEHARHWTARALAEKTGMAVPATRGIPRNNGPGPR